jgi:uncharacterized protein YcbK (DUF882 family)
MTFCAAAAALVIAHAQNTRANGDTRSLTFFHTHTNESATIIFRRDGRYSEEALTQLNWLLRDWRVNEPAKMDPRLFDILWELYREVGSRESIHVISAYRSPATNSMLRNRSRAVSDQSQHMSGNAMDIRLPDIDTARLRAAAMRLQYGGVGYYPGAAFVHIDTGSVRSWPRMTRDQLARLFPNGKTAHLPASGQPLPGYEEARAEIQTRNATLAAAGGGSLRPLFASLFAGSGERPGANTPPNASAFVESGIMATAPMPPRRPAALKLSNISEPAQSEGADSSNNVPSFSLDEQAQIKALFSRTASDVVLRPSRVVLARVRPGPILIGNTFVNVSPLRELGFASEPEPLTILEFTGPAVKALPKLRYAQVLP